MSLPSVSVVERAATRVPIETFSLTALDDKEISEGNDDVIIQIREIAEAIKVKVG